jgi:hypothetical protein
MCILYEQYIQNKKTGEDLDVIGRPFLTFFPLSKIRPLFQNAKFIHHPTFNTSSTPLVETEGNP